MDIDDVLASNIVSMVVEERDPSSFRDVEIAVVKQVYRACMVWGGRETKNTKSVQESLSPAWLDS